MGRGTQPTEDQTSRRGGRRSAPVGAPSRLRDASSTLPNGDAAHRRAAVVTAVEHPSTSDRWFHKLMQNGSDLIIVVDGNARLIYTNPATARVLGFRQDYFPGRRMLDFVHPDDRDRAQAAFGVRAAKAGQHPATLYRVRTASGGWRFLEVVATNLLDDPSVGGVVLNARDITDRTNLTRALRTLGRCNQVLVLSRDEDSLLEDSCRIIVDAGGYLLAWVGYAEHDDDRSIRPVASAGLTEYLHDARVTWSDEPSGRGPSGQAVRLGRPQVLHDMHRSRRYSPWRAAADRYGFRSSCAVPLRLRSETIGMLSIYAGEPGSFDDEALHVLQQLGDDLAYGIGRIRDAKALEASEERFRTLAAAAPIGILEVTAGGVVSYANDRSGEIAGRDGAALMGRGWIDAVLPEDAPRLIEISRSRQMGTVAERVRLRRPDGEIRHVNLSAAPQEGGPSSRYVVTLTDVTKEVEAEEALARQAFYDTLTDLPNRSLFLDRLEQELARRRRGAAAFAVLFVDLDDFKVVNDSLGHQAGDSVLREVAKRLADAVRLGETVARFSGDEFAIIVRELRGPEDAVTVANRVLRLLQRPIRHEGHEIIVTGSVGISIPDVDADALSLMRDADVAMYDAKAGGRNRYRIFDKDLHRKVVARFAMEGDLRRALARHEFVLHYQPSIDLRTGRPRGAEALVRWLHPVRGLVLPAEFVPVAEETGLIRELGDWVIREAIAQLARFDAEVAGPRLATLAVNVSARQLDDCDVCEMLARSVARHGVDPQRVAIELTESTVMSESGRARRPLEELRRLGFRVAIDDFGTGYSSLAYLHALPVTTVKVDRSFVRRLGTPSDDATPVVRAIVDLAHAMGLRVVAEGVEEKAQADLLTELGCDGAQGMLWAPPMPANELGRWLGSTATNNSHGTAAPLAT